jgi:hypothetical protein
MRCLERNVTRLHQKWCVHSFLPLGSRAKQPHLHVPEKYTLQDVTVTLTHSLHWDVELAGLYWQPEAASGLDQTCCRGFCSRSCRGETFHRLNMSVTATHGTGHYVSKQRQMRMRNWFFL